MSQITVFVYRIDKATNVCFLPLDLMPTRGFESILFHHEFVTQYHYTTCFTIQKSTLYTVDTILI